MGINNLIVCGGSENTKKRGIFLDRDGVINQVVMKDGCPFPPDNLDELVIFPRVYEELTEFKKRGWSLFIVTNQPDVARGLTSKTKVQQINRYIDDYLPVDEILTCFHDDDDECLCRKPKPGLILQAAKKYGINLTSSFMIGDRWKDIEAGKSAGCSTIYIDYGYNEKKPEFYDHRVRSFDAACKIIKEL